MLESFFNKAAGLQASNFIKKRLQYIFFSCECYETSKSTYFEERLRTAASELTLGSDCLGLSFWAVAFKTILTQ